MLILSDSHDYAAEMLPPDALGRLSPNPPPDLLARWLSHHFLAQGPQVQGTHPVVGDWRYLVLSHHATESQYDRMIELARGPDMPPDRLICAAGSGEGFHGFKGRAWATAPGNLHVTVHLAPNRVVPRFETAFTVLAVVSVVEAVDAVPGLRGRARIKWVNDILVDGAKVAGILAYTQTQSHVVQSVILGIGLNVRTAPEVERDAFVPAVGALRDFTDASPAQRDVLVPFMEALDRNYGTLLAGGYDTLLSRYRERSGVIGSHVTVCREGATDLADVLCDGRVTAMGDGLELYLEGREEPVRRGRIVQLGPPSDHAPDEADGTRSGHLSPQPDRLG